MRGERADHDAKSLCLIGSSPHARGTRRPANSPVARPRLIPACAGNARPFSYCSREITAHPRMRGERRSRMFQAVRQSGSSPHARGTRPRTSGILNLYRLIPACAGNAVARNAAPPDDTAHPRMRGERRDGLRVRQPAAGSSPHARGTLARGNRVLVIARLIPACAGNAPCHARHPRPRPAHPRMRGERGMGRIEEVLPVGSSPHARGTPFHPGSAHHFLRLIPACAGNAGIAMVRVWVVPAHPRMRGERILALLQHHDEFGSSPHARGTPSQLVVEQHLRRLIPACAGNAAS